MGNNVKRIDFTDEKELEAYIDRIRKMDYGEISTIYMENCEGLNRDILDKIEEELDCKFASGKDIKINNIEGLLLKISRGLNKELGRMDLLIISNELSDLVNIIRILPKDLNCIASIGVRGENLYEYILKETGISIYEPYKIDRAIKNFHIIINLSDELLFDLNNIRRQGIVVDFSQTRTLGEIEKLNRNILYIDDFNFQSKIDSPWIDKLISSKLYETIYGNELGRYRQVHGYDDYSYLSEYIRSKMTKRGRL